MTKPIPFKPADFETKWQKTWEEKGVYQPDLKKASKPFYNLMMFPYPSAEGLHVGNMYAFTGVDIYGRFKRMQGNDVFEPIGLDGFGIHSENYAIKIGKHPKEQAKISQKNFYRQLRASGNGFAWKNTLETYDPAYYRWTQWIFIQMFKHGLAYRKKSLINFCPSCKTVLSDEQVINGTCERCKSVVEKKAMEQWFFKITAYAEKLLQNIFKPSFKWSEKVKVGQRNWIGKKEGINITYKIVDKEGNPVKRQAGGTNEGIPNVATLGLTENSLQTGSPPLKRSLGHVSDRTRVDEELTITCFTTRPDTNFGATFVVVAPEHPFIIKLLSPNFPNGPYLPKKEIQDYVAKAKTKSEIDRIAEGREKTGVFTGFYAVNQLTNCKMPIYVTDFVLGHVGTGAVVGVPGHDLRDFEFAKKFNLPIIRVVMGQDGDTSPIEKSEQVQEEEGTMVNSGFLDGMEIKKAIGVMMDHLEKMGWGKRVITYKLRDWCISRQRYWGAPIPMIFCKKCNWVPVPEDQLPVLLPDLDDWKPEGTGKGPLAKLPEFYQTTCPKCGGAARRETDVCDTFLDSSWYFLRYPSVNMEAEKAGDASEGFPNVATLGFTENSLQTESPPLKRSLGHVSGRTRVNSDIENLPWDPSITKKWLPVHIYIGGAEHTVLHLLYARFVIMAFSDWGLIDFEEPFSQFYAHGLIIAEGAKMSKSRGNIIIPDEYIRKYGVDTLRTYLMFLGPFDAGGDFRDTGIAGMYRFLSRVWRLVCSVIPSEEGLKNTSDGGSPPAGGHDSSEVKESVMRFMHKTIKEVTEDLENLRYNTAIAHLMEFVNHLTESLKNTSEAPPSAGRGGPERAKRVEWDSSEVGESVKTLLLLLAPFAPHMTEELWQSLKNTSEAPPAAGRGDKLRRSRSSGSSEVEESTYNSIHLHPWPSYDPKYLEEDEVEIVIQVNGKIRDTIKIKAQDTSDGGEATTSTPPRWKNQKEVEDKAKKSEKVAKYLEGKIIRKTIFVPGRLLNFVV